MNHIIEAQSLIVPVGRHAIVGDLYFPQDSRAIVIFAHGSGSSRHSPRNKYVGEVLNKGGFATLLIDLLTPAEEAVDIQTAHLRFDILLLAERLVTVTDWLRQSTVGAKLAVGYFGASTGAAAALVAAAKRPEVIGAVVSRGGRPDLAGALLEKVHAPTLLIVGGNDKMVIELNDRAAEKLKAEHQIEIVPGATHLFEEAGALETVANLAREWFSRHLLRRSEAA